MREEKENFQSCVNHSTDLQTLFVTLWEADVNCNQELVLPGQDLKQGLEGQTAPPQL